LPVPTAHWEVDAEFTNVAVRIFAVAKVLDSDYGMTNLPKDCS